MLARAAVDAVLIQLAWPRQPGPAVPFLARPRFLTSVVSCTVLTVLVGLVLSPVVTLMFGVALLPFSWPYLAAVPILLGTAVALSQGGVGQAWWRRLPPARTAAWVLTTFLILSAAAALMVHLDTPGIVAVAGLAGVVDARAWYGLTAAAVQRSVEKPLHPWHWRATLQQIRRSLLDRTSWVPMAPLAAVMVLALVVGVTRLAFTGTVRFAHGTGDVVASADEAAGLIASGGSDQGGRPSKAVTGAKPRGAVLVVEGFGSSCCHAADGLRAAEPGMLVRQFSYLGLNAAGQPIPYGPAAGDLSIQALGDRMAAQVDQLYRQVGVPVDVVAESEGTLGLYAMLARHPHVPVRSVTLLSPIVEPGQLGQAGGTVPGAALTTLNRWTALPAGRRAGRRGGRERGHPGPVRDAGPAPARAGEVGDAAEPDRRAGPAGPGGRHRARRRADHAEQPGGRQWYGVGEGDLVGGMSPYGSSGAQELIDSVSEVGARYFEQVSHDRALPWLAVIPLADAVTLPACPWPRNVIFVDAFHGGLLGNASVRQLVEGFLSGGAAQVDTPSQRQLRSTAQLIAAAATAWRMPELSASCPAAGS